MRTLPAGLATAQQTVSANPIISAVLRAKRGSAARLDLTTLFTQSLSAFPFAVASAANGNIALAVLSAGSVFTGVSRAGFTALATAVAPAGGMGVAMATSPGTNAIALVYLSAAQTINFRVSSDGGVTWSAVLNTITCTGVVSDLAVAIGGGDVLIVAADNGGTIHAYRRDGSTGLIDPDVTLVPPGAAAIGSVALTYSGADWYALFSWTTANLTLVGSAIWGNGGQQAAHTWSTPKDVLGIAPGAAATPIVTGFAWGTDGGHAIIVERWAILGGYTNTPAYMLECSSTTAFAGAYWTEPAPFPYNEADGPDLAQSQVAGQGNHYVVAGVNLTGTLAPPADLDVSANIIAIDYQADHHNGSMVLTLTPLSLTDPLFALATSPGTIGLRVDMSLGYPVAGVNTVSPFPQRWITKVESSWVNGRYLTTITCQDGWALLHNIVARREAQFGTTLGLPTLTVDQIIHWLCARAGIDYTAPAATTLNARTPNWTVLPFNNYGTQMLDLMDKIEGWLLMTDSGATSIPLGAGEASVYTFGPAAHQIIQVFHAQEQQPANIVTIYNGTHGTNIIAEAFDGTNARLGGHMLHAHVDALLENANAQITANALLRKAQISAPTHGFSSFPQVAQELGDVVTFTDQLTGTVYTGRVRTYTLKFDRDKGEWLQTFSVSLI